MFLINDAVLLWHISRFCTLGSLLTKGQERLIVLLAISKNVPYSWGNFYACAITRFQKPQQLGRARIVCSSIIRCAAEPDLSGQRCCKLQLKLLLYASGSTGKEDLKADRRVRHYKEVGLQERPLAGPATIPVFYTVSVSACLFVRERFFQKVYGRPLPSTSPFTLFARQTEPQVVVLPLSHSLGRGENLVTIARFVKPLFANMHHHVHAVAAAGGPAEVNRCMLAPRHLHWMASVIVM